MSIGSIFIKVFLVASKMDADYTFNSCSWPMEEDPALKNAFTGSDWTWEENKAFENAIAAYYDDADMWDKIALAVPGKTIEDLKLHYKALVDDVEAIESGKVPVPNYPSKVRVRKERQSSRVAEQARGTPWTEEEHKQFLYGLQRFGGGDWKSIARYSVRTKTNSQVASHAQKYFKRLSTAKGKRLSINDIRTVNPEKLLALEKATMSCMPQCCKEGSANAGNGELLIPRGSKRAASGENSTAVHRRTVGAALRVDGGKLRYSIEASALRSEMPTHSAPVDVMMQDADGDGQFDVGCSTEVMDLDMSLFPHFLD